ncbi:hypothetical protein V8C86DRAFT_2881994 [Haematococcus lacustris]
MCWDGLGIMEGPAMPKHKTGLAGPGARSFRAGLAPSSNAVKLGWSGRESAGTAPFARQCSSKTRPAHEGSSQGCGSSPGRPAVWAAPVVDSVFIKGARFYGYHGVLPAEQQVGQPFVVDVRMGLDLRAAGASDDLQHTVSYAEAFQLVKAVMEGPPVALLEHLAHTIASQLLTSFPAVQHVTVAVSKTHIPALSAAVQAVGVEVYRRRGEA